LPGGRSTIAPAEEFADGGDTSRRSALPGAKAPLPTPPPSPYQLGADSGVLK